MEHPASASDTTQPDATGHKEPRGSWNPRWRLALIGSLLFHLLLVGVLLVGYFPQRNSKSATPSNSALAAASGGDVPADAVVAQATKLGLSDEETPAAETEPAVQTEQIASAVTSAIENSDRASDERKRDELRRNLARLEQLATPQSIDEVGAEVRSAMSLPDRAVAPAETPVVGPFDFDTAQFHDVVREPEESGGWRHRSVLVDAAGRMLETELNANEGKSAYETMRMIKSSPLGEALYRSLVMPMLDQLIPRSTRQPDSFSEEEREQLVPPSPPGASP